jgi:NADPH:quinone reductase-like Zn-dependent oxidoreductase
MKAMTVDRFGGQMQLSDLPRPVPGDGEVLVRVHAASLNSWDWDIFAGTLQGRLGSPFKPAHRVLGADIAGEVVEIGSGVTRFRPGDRVFGDLSGGDWGGLAEFATAKGHILAIIPDGMSFTDAASIPQAGLLALQGLRQGGLESAKRVLINGAGGGAGSFAIQIACAAGAEVTGVDSALKLDFMSSLGAAHVLDYAATDFAEASATSDLVLDMVFRRSTGSALKSLAPGGRYVIVGGRSGPLLAAATYGAFRAKMVGKMIGLLIHRPSAADLEEMKRLFASGKMSPAIDRIVPLADTESALRHLGSGRARGKIVVAVLLAD